MRIGLTARPCNSLAPGVSSVLADQRKAMGPMKSYRSATLSLCGGLVAALLSSAASAQPSPQNIPEIPTPRPPVAPGVAAPEQPLARGQRVTERPRPEYDARGVRLGTFFLYPRVELDELFNDNVFATNSNKSSDFITAVSPTLELRSNWSRHELDLRTGLSKGWYLDNSSEDYLDYFAAGDGRFDIDRNHAITGGARYERLHEERDSPDTPGGAAEPVEFNIYSANAGFVQQGLRVGYEALMDVRREEYEAVPAVGGSVISQSIRDVNIYTPSARVSYEVAPGYRGFVRGAVNWRNYDHTSPIAGAADLDRDSWGYRADVGATVDITGVTYAEASIGYLSQEYNDDRLSAINGFDVGARVVWNATQLTSVVLNVDRQVQDSNNFAVGVGTTSPGYLRSNVGLSVDHELFRNLLLNGRINYQNDDYEGIDRTDNRFDIGAGVRYLLNNNAYLGGSYTLTRRDSDGALATGGFTRNLFLIRLGLQL